MQAAENFSREITIIKDKKVGITGDDIEKFEVSLPFDNITIGAFYELVKKLEEQSSGTSLGCVKFDKL